MTSQRSVKVRAEPEVQAAKSSWAGDRQSDSEGVFLEKVAEKEHRR